MEDEDHENEKKWNHSPENIRKKSVFIALKISFIKNKYKNESSKEN